MAALVPCFHPIPAYQDGPGGKVILHPPIGYATMALPCGGCLGCRSARATAWAARCVHEARLYVHNSFVTLTYDERNLPASGHLDARALQLFVKRLRKRAVSDERILTDRSKGVRYFAAGEYGELNGRPHYHLILFNCSFADGKDCGKKLKVSSCLSELWPFGDAKYGEMTGKSANYVAKYAVKKQGGIDCDADGVVRPKPFARMSLRPGIGAEWVKKFAADLKHGYLVSDGKEGKIPRYYKEVLRRDYPFLAEAAESGAVCYRSGRPPESRERLEAGEKILEARKLLFASRNL